MQAYLNDKLVGEGYLDQMDWSFGEVVAYASRGTKVLPGDAICSGTVPTCCLAEHFASSLATSLKSSEGNIEYAGGPIGTFPGWLEPEDTVRFDVEVLGSIVQEILPSVPVHRLRSGF